MAIYHAYGVLQFERHGDPIEIEANSDSEAIRKAEQHVNGVDVMLWQGARFVITLKSKQ